MMRVLSTPAHLLYAVFFPVLMPFRLGWNWMRVRGELRGVVWSRARLHSAVHEGALVAGPPLAAFGAWGRTGLRGGVRAAPAGTCAGRCSGWVGARLVVLAVQGARRGEGAERTYEQATPRASRALHRPATPPCSAVPLVGLTLVLLPVALILSI